MTHLRWRVDGAAAGSSRRRLRIGPLRGPDFGTSCPSTTAFVRRFPWSPARRIAAFERERRALVGRRPVHEDLAAVDIELGDGAAVDAVAGESFLDGGAYHDARGRRQHLHALRVIFHSKRFREALTQRACRPVNCEGRAR